MLILKSERCRSFRELRPQVGSGKVLESRECVSELLGRGSAGETFEEGDLVHLAEGEEVEAGGKADSSLVTPELT